MSEFDEWYEENSWDLENRYDAEKSFKAGQQSQQTKIDEMQEQLRIEREQGTEYFTDTHSLISERDELQARIDVYELHIKTLKNIHENDFNEESESSYILGNLDGFFECIEADLKGNKDEN